MLLNAVFRKFPHAHYPIDGAYASGTVDSGSALSIRFKGKDKAKIKYIAVKRKTVGIINFFSTFL